MLNGNSPVPKKSVDIPVITSNSVFAVPPPKAGTENSPEVSSGEMNQNY